MPRLSKSLSQRKIRLLVGLALAGILYFQFELMEVNEVVWRPGTPAVIAAERETAEPFERRIRRDPLSALIEARDLHRRQVKDYQCTLVKQEALPSGMSEEQEIDVKFRHDPYSVMFHWRRNPGLADRVIYVKDRWIDEDAENPDERQLAVCQPGAVARLLIKSIKQPIHGKRAQLSSRRYLDEFGFTRALDLLIKYCERAQQDGVLRLEFCGESRFDGRPVWVIRRFLPYTGEGGAYPDKLAEIFIDKEYRIPVAVYCFSTDYKDPQHLLGKYEYRNIKLDSGLTEADFDPVTYGM
ncbi:MAG TPA: DUF1571 domain-containing protein [Phycisphaerae bacterium]|nr:DUF1571 domain-containing protein [Phycisphaerae bacterium]